MLGWPKQLLAYLRPPNKVSELLHCMHHGLVREVPSSEWLFKSNWLFPTF
jgi:hypothetical protein